MAIDKKSAKKMFPNLVKELECSENKVRIDSVRPNAEEAEEAAQGDETLQGAPKQVLPDKFRHYTPTVVDFIRRCDTIAQADEIIAYMLKRGEISEKVANDVREQLKKDGLRSFGPKKESDYYCKQGGLF